MKNIVFFVMVVIVSLLCPAGYGLLSDVKAAANAESSNLDGNWSVTEKFCVNASTGLTCGTTKFKITITDDVVYEEEDEIGSAALKGNKVSFDYNTDYLSTKFEEIFKQGGFEVTVESLDMKKYVGKLKKNRMSGKIKGTVDVYFTLFETTVSYDYTGTFKGKKQR
jgi:hypothetical protein